ncbi:hypothetical protein AVEN_35467-1 [Araneus ventricosus]|uniref:Uncharacterized protein n=1 Tax=Araneus ventricosus TaxID=182803 RepID=A0A4Y2LTF3_ARAVE|nr:hypothetical protein AVEN_35467-1 [Araneus ventricosus]
MRLYLSSFEPNFIKWRPMKQARELYSVSKHHESYFGRASVLTSDVSLTPERIRGSGFTKGTTGSGSDQSDPDPLVGTNPLVPGPNEMDRRSRMVPK